VDSRAVEFVLRLSGLKSATPESSVVVFTTVDGTTYAKLKVLSALTGAGVPSIIRNAVEAYLQRKDIKELLDSYFLLLSAEEGEGGVGGAAPSRADKTIDYNALSCMDDHVAERLPLSVKLAAVSYDT